MAVLAGLIALAAWGWVPSDVSSPGCRLSENGAWISVDWTSQPVDLAAVAELAENAAQRQMRTLFPFTTYIKQDGSFSTSYDYAAEFVAAFRRANQETRLLAWIGIPLQNENGLGVKGWVDLANEAERRKIVLFMPQLLEESGFDGVHLDAETVRNGDPHFLRLLDEVRVAIGPSRLLSVAGNDWRPEWVSLMPVVGPYKWGSHYYRAVGERVDQIAAMTYDSLMPHPALYRLWMREQVKGIGRSLAGADAELLIGISVSREKSITHRPDVESLPNGLAGMCAGVRHLSPKSHPVDGVAVYAAWEASEADWQVWQAR